MPYKGILKMPKNFSKVFSAELEGIEAHLVEVETDLHVGLHSFQIVGLADKAVSEAKERVSAALKNVGVKPPTKENRRIVVNLAPADVQKNGSHYDLAIAIGYLLATGQIKPLVKTNILFAGELALDGVIRPIAGALNFAMLAQRLGIDEFLLPAENALEAALLSDIRVIPVHTLAEVIDHLEGRRLITPQPLTAPAQFINHSSQIDLAHVKGQREAKRALTIAAAGGHHLAMIGAPGGGKSLLAQALSSILPVCTREEIIEITQVHSAAGLLINGSCVAERPFRAPHHNASSAAIIGGGSTPRPGEISLAHHGVLFMDEAPEFRRDVLEGLRQPLEQGHVMIARAKSHITYPARFTLVLAMNPCPCGYHGDEERECRCTPNEVIRYQKKISGPLLDRIDLQINVPRVALATLTATAPPASESAAAKATIEQARQRQAARLKGLRTNAEMTSQECDSLIALDDGAKKVIGQVVAKSLLSARGYYRVLKTAQTIADLESATTVRADHISEAFAYRVRD